MSYSAAKAELDDAFVKVDWHDRNNLNESSPSGVKSEGKRGFYGDWVKQSSGRHSTPELFGADALQKIYPKHSIVMTTDYKINVLNLPGVSYEPLKDTPVVSETFFYPLARSKSPIPGVLVDAVQFGAFNLTWENYEFIVYIVQFTIGFSHTTQTYILHEGPEEPARSLILGAGLWGEQLHNEIWVFNQGFWSKDAALWVDIQKADWEDVILKEDFKKSLQKDVFGFFSSEAIYKELSIPWKRGMIMHGPPGNGKTISIKAIMKTCDALGYAPLYVKSFQSWMGEEGSMAAVFDKARQLSPSVVILEDLDSLINDQNRSFFLNQLDGLQGNDGLLVIGTTNHFERLDPGLSTRPSRFDRKFLFDDPDLDERALYAQYWQDKLKPNDSISFPDSLVGEIADATDKFSFAYLKEAFVSSLVLIATTEEDKKPSFEAVLKDQIKILRKQLNKPGVDGILGSTSHGVTEFGEPISQPRSSGMRAVLNTLSQSMIRGEPAPKKLYTTGHNVHGTGIPSVGQGGIRRQVQPVRKGGFPASLLASPSIAGLADRVYGTPIDIEDDVQDPREQTVRGGGAVSEQSGRNVRNLLDRLSLNENGLQDQRVYTTSVSPNGPHPPQLPGAWDISGHTGRDGFGPRAPARRTQGE